MNSAADQDWSRPWEAIGKTTLDTTLGAAGGAATGWFMRALPKAIADEWYGVDNVPKNLKWPETMDELDALNARLKSGDVPNETQLKLESGSGQGYNGNNPEAYNAYLKMLDDLKQAQKSGMTAREFAMRKGVPSSLTDEEARLLDEYNLKMNTEGVGDVNFDIKKLINSGNQLDKGGELTKAGRALEKHGSRSGSIYPQATGNVANKNALGNQTLESILNNPNATSVIRYHAMYGNILEIKIPGGMGARFSADGSTFIGFLE